MFALVVSLLFGLLCILVPFGLVVALISWLRGGIGVRGHWRTSRNGNPYWVGPYTRRR